VKPTGKVLAFAGALQLALALALPALYQQLVALTPAQAHAVWFAFFALVALVPTALAVLMKGELARVARAAGSPEGKPEAQRRALALSLKSAVAVVGCELLGLAGLLLALLATHAEAAVIAGVLLCSAALLLLLPVPVYAYARVTLQPLALSVGDERPPEIARGWSVAIQLGYGIAAVAWAALAPAAVFGAAQLDRSTATDARVRAQAAGVRLAAATAGLDVTEAAALLARVTLEGGERILQRAPSGVLLPTDAAAELEGHPYVEVPLGGALRGGAVRVYYAARPVARAPLLLVTVVMLLLTLGVAWLVGSSVASDLNSLTEQIDRVAQKQEPGRMRAVATAEVRHLTHSVNRLLERVPRFTVESFLAIERAEDAQRMKAQFLANMSHDLRSPLNSILGFSELLLRGVEGEITPRQRRKIVELSDHGNHLLRLLNEILDTAKLESGKMELHRQLSPPAELVRAAVQEARRGRPPTQGDGVEIELQPGLHLIHVDPLRVTQAVTHLLNWAFDAQPPDAPAGPPITLKVSEPEDGPTRKLIVEVGSGRTLDEREASYLFDGFRGGSGVGGLHLALPLARRLAELHGGSLELVAPKPARVRLTILPPPPPPSAGAKRKV
jgi:signal transduction histidine kinase